jgi:hypothetical protein
MKIHPLQFLALQLMGTEKTFHNVNHLYIQENLNSIAGKVKNASCLGNGILLVEIVNKKLSHKPVKTTLLRL